MRRASDFHSRGERKRLCFLKTPSIKGCHLTCRVGGCSWAAPPTWSFAILLFTGGQRGADGGGQPGPALPDPASLQPAPPRFSCIPQLCLLPAGIVKGPFLITSIPAASQGQGWDGDGSVRGLHFQNNIHYHIHSVFISQMYGSVTMEKKENSEFVLKRYSN